MPRYYAFLLLLVGFLFSTCAQAPGEAEEATVLESAAREDSTAVKGTGRVQIAVTPAKKGTFQMRTLTNGTLKAERRTELQFTASGTLVFWQQKVGDRVAAGAILARLDTTDLHLRREKAMLQLIDARSKLDDLLVSQRGKAGDDNSVSAEKFKVISGMSGYSQALHALTEIDYEVSKTVLRAPFDGMVLDVKADLYQQVGPGTSLCRLVDLQSFEAVFKLLESEALAVSVGQSVLVSVAAQSSKTQRARISRILPQVNEQGLVEVRAKLDGSGIPLWEGLHVNIAIEKPVPNQILVPKESLVLRSGRPVIFVYDPESRLAKWQYVTVAHENDRELAISDGLNEGQLVIIKGNAHLDHDAEVEVE